MKIKMRDLNYSFDDAGETVGTSVSFTGSDGASYINATIKVTADDLKESQELANLSMNDIASLARQKFANYTAVAK